jgi:hypothetical protein
MTTGPSKIDSAPKVPSLNLTQDPTASTVETIARKQLSPPPSPTSAKLRSKEQAKDQQLQQKYNEACELIDSQPEQARALFFELIEGTPIAEDRLIFLASCKIGYAYTWPEDSQERNDAALIAKATLDQVYGNRSAWDSLGEEAKIIHQYKYLRSCLKNFENLVRNEVISLEDNVKLQIEECTRHIPLITDFYDKLIEGDRLEEDEAKREVYHQALKMIEGFEEPGYLLARAFGVTNLALTYRFDDNNLFSIGAITQTVLAYQQREALFTSDQAKLTTLNQFSKLFHHLIQLFSDGSEQLVAINKMLEECIQELARCKSSIPKDGPKVSPRVSKEPVDPWKTVKLVIAFGFAAVVIAGAFVLGRRYITRLN